MKAALRDLIRPIAIAVGLNGQRVSSETRLSLSRRRFVQLSYQRIEGYDVRGHFGDQSIDASYQFVVEGFIVARLKFIETTLGRTEIERSSFADIGDSNGIFLRALGKCGTSINASPAALDNIQGFDKLLAGLPQIPLPDGSFDYVLCFETLEHLHDPIGGLKELARLARRGIFVSIPLTKRTVFNPYWPDRARPATEQHVFEFSDEDFRTLLTYAGLRLASRAVHEVFDAPRTWRELIAVFAWRVPDRNIWLGCFRQFSMAFLVHGARGDEPQCR